MDLMGEVRTKPDSHRCIPACYALQPLYILPPVHSIAGLLDPPKCLFLHDSLHFSKEKTD